MAVSVDRRRVAAADRGQLVCSTSPFLCQLIAAASRRRTANAQRGRDLDLVSVDRRRVAAADIEGKDKEAEQVGVSVDRRRVAAADISTTTPKRATAISVS